MALALAERAFVPRRVGVPVGALAVHVAVDDLACVRVRRRPSEPGARPAGGTRRATFVAVWPQEPRERHPFRFALGEAVRAMRRLHAALGAAAARRAHNIYKFF